MTAFMEYTGFSGWGMDPYEALIFWGRTKEGKQYQIQAPIDECEASWFMDEIVEEPQVGMKIHFAHYDYIVTSIEKDGIYPVIIFKKI